MFETSIFIFANDMASILKKK